MTGSFQFQFWKKKHDVQGLLFTINNGLIFNEQHRKHHIKNKNHHNRGSTYSQWLTTSSIVASASITAKNWAVTNHSFDNAEEKHEKDYPPLQWIRTQGDRTLFLNLFEITIINNNKRHLDILAACCFLKRSHRIVIWRLSGTASSSRSTKIIPFLSQAKNCLQRRPPP